VASEPDPGAARSRQRGGIGARARDIWRAFRGKPKTPVDPMAGPPHSSELEIRNGDEEEA
jgi:hypothetical protein